MSEIAEEAEKILPYRDRLDWLKTTSNKTVQDAVSIAISDATLTLDNIGAIVVFTQGGTTARRISKFRPKAPILAVTFTKDTQRKLESYWGVMPIVSDVQNQMTNDDDLATLFAKDYGVKKGQLIIISAGYPTGEGSANMMKIIEVK
jgi:pyruvate kinase